MTGMIVESCERFHSVGKIRKAHGIRGELFLISFSKNFDWLSDVDEAQLVRKIKNAEGKYEEHRFSFPIKKSKDHKVGRILKLEGINDRNMAEEFEGAVFQVPKELFSNDENNEEYYLLQLKGFQLFNQEDALLGEVVDFGNNNAHDLLVIEKDGHRFEVPYVDELILKLDFSEKSLQMNLPEGIEQTE